MPIDFPNYQLSNLWIFYPIDFPTYHLFNPSSTGSWQAVTAKSLELFSNLMQESPIKFCQQFFEPNIDEMKLMAFLIAFADINLI